jgi:arylsulfatase
MTLRALSCLAVAVCLVACAGQPRPARESLHARLITQEPSDALDLTRLAERTVAFEWRFRRGADLDPWRGQNVDLAAARAAGGLKVAFARADPTVRPSLVRNVDLDAATIDAIEVEVAGPRRDFRSRGQVQLYWAGPGQAFVEARAVRVDASDAVGEYETTYALPVGAHALWAGRIAQLRLDPTSAPDDTVLVQAVRGVRHVPAPNALSAALEVPWKVTLGEDTRSALLAPPAHVNSWPLKVPPEGRLTFGYGSAGSIRVPVRFRVYATEDGRPARELFAVTASPGDTPVGWRDVSVDLAPIAGRQVTLRFETTTDSPIDPSRGTPVWAHPEVWRGTEGPPSPHVILVCLDTLRADRLSLYGNARLTSPRLEEWARRRAVVFDSVVAASPWTLPSHASLFTGLDALRHGVNQGYPMPRVLPAMATLFRQAGYATAAVTGGGYLSPQYGFDHGFDRFYAWPRGRLDDEREWTSGVDRAVEWLGAQGARPSFLFLHTYAIHAPYRPREPYWSRLNAPPRPGVDILPFSVRPDADDGFLVKKEFRKKEVAGGAWVPLDGPGRQDVTALYDSNVAYADEELGRLLRALQQLGLEGRTVVAVTSDHGEALGEHGLAEHAYLYDFNLMVPLVIALPDGRGAGRRLPQQVRTVDILPTLLEAAGLRTPAGIDGASLLPLIAGRTEAAPRDAWSYAASTNYGISLRQGNASKYVYNNTAWPEACGREELFRLAVDRVEERNTAGASDTADLRRRVQRTLESQSTGLNVRFSNATGRSYRASLEAPFLHQVRVKSPGRCGDVAWNPAGRVEVTMPPGRETVILLEGVGPEGIKVGAASGAVRFQATVDPWKLDQPWQVAFDGARWLPTGPSPVPPASGIVMRWVGGAQAANRRPMDVDPTVREQLKALGYVH